MKKINNKGFSLVELMVVVAIIGILSAIAIPNFQRFQRKSRQSEAKNLLGGIYSAEKAFHVEWNQYLGDIDTAGFIPSGQLRYNAGFTATLALPAGYQGPPASGFFNTTAVCGSATYSTQCAVPATAIAVANSVTPAGAGLAATFTAGAVTADTTINAAAANDTWTMNQAGLLANAVSGI